MYKELTLLLETWEAVRKSWLWKHTHTPATCVGAEATTAAAIIMIKTYCPDLFKELEALFNRHIEMSDLSVSLSVWVCLSQLDARVALKQRTKQS